MTVSSEIPGPNDSGLTALVMLLRFHGVGADPAQIRHQAGTNAIGTAEMVRCAKEFGLKARELKTNWVRLAKTPLPAIAVLKDGDFLLLGKVGDDKVVVQSTKTPRPCTPVSAICSIPRLRAPGPPGSCGPRMSMLAR